MTAMHDNAARAALWQAYCHHGSHAWTPSRHNPHGPQYCRALALGWLWEPRPGALAITPDGLDALAGYMPRPAPDRTEKPVEEPAR